MFSRIPSCALSLQPQSQASCEIDPRTLQTFVIVACVTGANPGELRGLARRDLQVHKHLLRVRNARSQETRSVPISPELCGLLLSFSRWRFGTKTANNPLFSTKQEKKISANQIASAFTRLCQNAGVKRLDGLDRNPRLLDLRNTFAVHRVAAWIESDMNLDRMLPALAAYMGLENLPSSERYLKMTPERFLEPLRLLSPRKRRTHWRDDPALVTFFAKL